MAERFGGKYSPGQGAKPQGAPPGGKTPPFHGQRRSRAGGRVNFLFAAPVPLVISAFWQDPVGLAQNLVAFGILMLAARWPENPRSHARSSPAF